MWIGKRFRKQVFYGPDKTIWKVGKKISEKEIRSDTYLYNRGQDTSEAQAVYHCRQIKGPSVGQKAILKVRMQIPEYDHPSSDLLARAREASDVYGIGTSQEIRALKWFTERGSSVTPRLLHLIQTYQPGFRFPVPGGWLVFLLMEKVPGVPLTEFWDYDLPKREKIRQAFGRSMAEFYDHQATQFDNRLANLIYDEDQDKCYFIDFEDVMIDLEWPEPPLDSLLLELEYKHWMLAEEEPRLEESTEEADLYLI